MHGPARRADSASEDALLNSSSLEASLSFLRGFRRTRTLLTRTQARMEASESLSESCAAARRLLAGRSVMVMADSPTVTEDTDPTAVPAADNLNPIYSVTRTQACWMPPPEPLAP